MNIYLQTDSKGNNDTKNQASFMVPQAMMTENFKSIKKTITHHAMGTARDKGLKRRVKMGTAILAD